MVALIFFLLTNKTHLPLFPRPAIDATAKKLNVAIILLVIAGKHLR
jgi:hypothetical protein